MTTSISYFHAPVASWRTDRGQFVAASLEPALTVTLQQVYQLITADAALRRLTEEVRQSSDLGEAKKRLLPFVTPFGTFRRRNCQSLLQLSGLLPVDIDKLSSPQEAGELRDRLAADRFLCPALAFVSPSGKGVKLFVPYATERVLSGQTTLTELFQWTATYIEAVYRRPVDGSGKDVVRACFLCHDPHAKSSLFTHP